MYTALGAAELKQATRSTQRVSNFLGVAGGHFRNGANAKDYAPNCTA